VTTPTPDGTVRGPLGQALVQLAALRDALAHLDAREEGHWDATSPVLQSVMALDDALAELRRDVDVLMPPQGGRGYKPVPTRQWWRPMNDPERADAVRELAGWVDEVFTPYYGHLARRVGKCWPEHAFCCVVLDWLAELWQVLFLHPTRTAGLLQSQAEFSTRILPAAVDQLAAETTGSCEHTRGSR
jgi:hypothetical protein